MIQIVFDHPEFLAISKPPNIPFHTEDDQVGIVQRLRESYKTSQLFPVHRLDRVTSGLMLFAKTQETNKLLSELFQARGIEKTYLAISDRKPKKKQGKVVGDMQKSRGGSYKLMRSKDKPAVTHFRSRPFEYGNQNYYGFELHPRTGKTHQLRVALKAMGSPILGDERYSGGEAQRCYLHAYRLKFSLFDTDYEITADAAQFDQQDIFALALTALEIV